MLQGGWGIEAKFPYTCVYLFERDLIEWGTAFFYRDQVYDLIVYDRDLGSCAFFV